MARPHSKSLASRYSTIVMLKDQTIAVWQKMLTDETPSCQMSDRRESFKMLDQAEK